MQHFNEEHIISTYNTKSAQKRRERFAKTKEILEGYETERQLEDTIEEKNAKILNESFTESVHNSIKQSKVDHSANTNNIKYIEETFDNICRDLFNYVVYESLLLDENIKSENYNYIKETCNNFFDTYASKNMICVKENSAFDDILHTADRYLKEEADLNQGIDLSKILKKTVLAEDMLLFYATESIKLKTAESIKNEKKGTVIKENLINEDKYVDPSKSLFRYLFEENIQEVVEDNKDTRPEYLQDMAMVETILDYTILEAANTLQIASFNNLKKVINRK